MSVESEPVPINYLTTKEAARHLKLSPKTLEKHRVAGTGPSYRKHGGKVVYVEGDLDDWSARGMRKSTSDAGRPDAPKPYRHGLR
ncbi:MAG TPA: helix-turn-helix domain-containing protein [Alphaproteobacteria bacterium]|nr:helix-turn-helix domain-containing protein [Alphaproteobacteria bacterium]